MALSLAGADFDLHLAKWVNSGRVDAGHHGWRVHADSGSGG
jgi:hypothetical protein